MSTADDTPSAASNPPDRQLAGIRHVDVPEVELTEELAERREAMAELGQAMRDLTSRAIGSEVSVDVMRRVAEDVRRLAVPLGQPLRLEAKLIDVLGIRAAIQGSISLASHPDTSLVEAEGRFLALRRERATRLFGGERTV